MNDANWNNRHHISPSLFNSKNHKYYKVSDKNLSITQNADAHPPWNQIINMRYFFRCILTRTSRTSSKSWSTHKDSLTLMMKTKLKELGCLTTRNYPKRETSTENSVGSKTSTLNSRRTTTNCIPLIVSSSMAQKITTTNSITQRWLILNSSARTHPKAQLQDSQTNKCQWQQGLALATSVVDLCNLSLMPSPNSVARCILPPLYLTKIETTSTKLLTMSKNQWKLQLKSHSWDHRSTPNPSAKRSMVLSWDRIWTIDHTLCPRIRWERQEW